MKTKQILTGLLSIVAAAAILAGVRFGLSGTRQEIAQFEQQEMIRFMLPESTTFTPEEYTGEDETIAAVYKGETGYVVETVTNGYAGEIRMLVGVDNDGTVRGLTVRSMEETWGLGAQALTDTDFLVQFLFTQGDAEVGETVDALTGATVTSKAIARSVNAAVGFVTGADTSSGATSWGG